MGIVGEPERAERLFGDSQRFVEQPWVEILWASRDDHTLGEHDLARMLVQQVSTLLTDHAGVGDRPPEEEGVVGSGRGVVELRPLDVIGREGGLRDAGQQIRVPSSRDQGIRSEDHPLADGPSPTDQERPGVGRRR
ncbi:hypothetical protein [Catenulispora acidiphila]|uniref:hypothetical protein n=1 Tax=Catenulispora acidiphila TaxID=304895 RepID=UPI00019E0526|nr:hypothetical protein [Catenulispora acidiphila]